MRRLITFSAVLLGFALAARISLAQTPLNQLTESERRSGWKLLFDGQTADHWRGYKKDKIGDGWVIEDGAIVRKKGGAGDIITKEQFDSFEIQLEYNISKGGNSGLMFHVTEELGAPWQTGPEIQIQDNVDGHDPQKSGWLYQLYKPSKPAWAKRFEAQVGYSSPEVDDATRPAGQWNHMYLRVTARDGELCLNGVSYYKFQKGSDDWNKQVEKSKFKQYEQFGKPTKGHICLQDHGNLVSFRNIKYRDLPDGKAPEPIDGVLELKTVEAFPELTYEGYEPIDDSGKTQMIRPMQLESVNDGTQRLFLTSQAGMIHVLDGPGAKKAKMFLDIRDRVHQWRKDDEEGLLGVAFHPKFKENGQVFVYYNPEGKPRGIHLSRFTRSKDDPNKADPDSEEVILELKQPFSNHNGGPMGFGHDGYLYVGMGDGGGRNDPERSAQNLSNLLGTVFRLDVDHKDPGKNYAIPADNPFAGKNNIPGALQEIYAYGFRNPWRLTFDRKTGACWLADVGQDIWEEIDIVKKGGNYGWSVREGTHNFNNPPGASEVKTVQPVWEYDHQIGKSITGGYVYRGKAIPELDGHYLYGDYVSGKLWALKFDEKAGAVERNMSIPWNNLPIVAFGQDADGEIYVMTPTATGRGIYKIVK